VNFTTLAYVPTYDSFAGAA